MAKLSVVFSDEASNGLSPEGKAAPYNNLFDKILEQDLIEVYGPDFSQMFRNMRFFDFCGYSLSELFTYEWLALFKRDAFIALARYQGAAFICSGNVYEMMPTGAGWY